MDIDFPLYYDVLYELVSNVNIGEHIIHLCKNLTKKIQKVLL